MYFLQDPEGVANSLSLEAIGVGSVQDLFEHLFRGRSLEG